MNLITTCHTHGLSSSLSYCVQILHFSIPLFIPVSSFIILILSFLPFVLLFLSLTCLALSGFILRKGLIDTSKLPCIFFEVTPPSDSKQSAFATEQLFKTIHTLGITSSWKDIFLGKKKTYAFELVSTKKEGIRYIIKIPTSDSMTIKNNLLSFLPGVKIKEIADYFPRDVQSLKNQSIKTVEFSLKKHFAIPLQTQTLLSQHDPIAYMSGNMRNLKENESMSYQCIITPISHKTHPRIIHTIEKITLCFYQGLDASDLLVKRSPIANMVGSTWIFCINLFVFVLLSPLSIITYFMFNDSKETLPFWLFSKSKRKKITELSLHKQNIHTLVSDKIGKELFEVTLRLALLSQDTQNHSSRIQGFLSSLATFQNEQLQGLKQTRSYLRSASNPICKQFMFFKNTNRLLSLTQNSVLSVAEISSLFHFPFFPITKTENLVKVTSQNLPAPLSLKQDTQNLDIVFAKNTFGESNTAIGLNQEERRRHVYIIGATGMGKSTLLNTMIGADTRSGKGLAVIDPHGELITHVLSEIPQERIQDVIYFNPDDTNYPIGLNLLEIPSDMSEDEKQRYKGFITTSLISIFSKLSAAHAWGPRMEHILRSVTLTALETKQPTLFTIQRLLIDKTYRKQIIATLKNPALLLFWQEFQQMGSFQVAEAIAPLTNKLGKFLVDPLVAHIVGQKTSTINFAEIMDTGKILLCDVSKGKIGEDFSTLFGSLVTSSLELAAQRRIRRKEKDRRDFYLYIDEFQNFATSSFANIMSESRKYHLNAILAHQTIAQIENKDLVNIILANTGTVISFRTGSPLDEEYILPYFSPLVSKGEIANLPSYTFYIKINGKFPEDGFSGETIFAEHCENEPGVEKITSHSQDAYGTPKAIVEKMVANEYENLFESEDTKKEKAEKRQKAQNHYTKPKSTSTTS